MIHGSFGVQGVLTSLHSHKAGLLWVHPPLLARRGADAALQALAGAAADCK